MATSNDDLIGHKITRVRAMTKNEANSEGWDIHGRRGAPPVIELSNGVKIYPSRDPEGNGPGALFGVDGSGNSFAL